MNLVSLVENFEWLFVTPAAIYNNCNFTKQYWSNILSNELLGGNIWTPPLILSRVRCQWKVCYNKLKRGDFQKTDGWGESQDICQELAITSGHIKSQPRYGTQLLWLEMTLFSQKEKHETEKHS